MSKTMTWLQNATSFHHRIMMRFLRNRGWVVFYLEKQARECKDMCWLKLYEADLEPGSDLCWQEIKRRRDNEKAKTINE